MGMTLFNLNLYYDIFYIKHENLKRIFIKFRIYNQCKNCGLLLQFPDSSLQKKIRPAHIWKTCIQCQMFTCLLSMSSLLNRKTYKNNFEKREVKFSVKN